MMIEPLRYCWGSIRFVIDDRCDSPHIAVDGTQLAYTPKARHVTK